MVAIVAGRGESGGLDPTCGVNAIRFDDGNLTRFVSECPKNKMDINVKGRNKRGAWASGGYLHATNQLISEAFISNLVGEGILNSVPNELANFLSLFLLCKG